MISSTPDVQPDNRENRPQTNDADLGLICANRPDAPQPVDEEDLLQRFVAAIADHFDVACVRVWSLTGDSKRLKLRAASGMELPFDALQDNVPVDGSELGQVVARRALYVADCLDSSAPDDVKSWATRVGVSRFVAVPILVEDRTWGVLALFASSRDAGPQPELLSAVARVIGQAVAGFASGTGERSSLDLLASLLPCLPAAVVALDRDGLIVHWSGQAETMFGWSRDEVVGKPLPIFPAERRHEDVDAAQAAACPARVHRGQAVCQRADQSRLHVQRTTAPLFNDKSEIIGRVEYVTDDSQRIQMSRCLQVQARVAHILAGSRGIDDAVDPLLTALGEWLGCDAAELWRLDDSRSVLSRSGVWARTSEIRERLEAAERRVKSDSSHWPARACRQSEVNCDAKPDDSDVLAVYPSARLLRVPVAGLAIPIRRNSERLGAVTCIGHSLPTADLFVTQTIEFVGDALAQFLTRVETETALADAEANALQSQKMDALGLLAGGVAHDFNNVLTVILAYSELGLDESGEDDVRHEMFTEIHGAGERAAAMTRQLLAVSRQQQTQAVVCDLNLVVDNMRRMLQRLVGARITIDVDSKAGSALVMADPNKLEQVLLNLVVNARDAMPDGGAIRLTTEVVTPSGMTTRRYGTRPGEYVKLSVSDTGCGMDEATSARIFEPFFTTKDAGNGTGMGLSTVSGIVKQGGGFLEVHSAPNAGTTISVLLPQCRQTLATQTIEQPSESLHCGTESVLVVENDDSVRSLIRRLLEIRGYTVHEAAHGGEALRILKSKRPAIDLVVAEFPTPVVDGVTLAREMRRLPSKPRLLLISGNTEPPAELDLDCSRQFLRKPFTSADLARQVRLALGCAPSGNRP